MSSGPKPSANSPQKDDTASILADLNGGGVESPAMPDLGGVNPSAPKSKYKVHSQTLVIALVLVASGAALFMMRKQGKGAGVNFNPPKIDYQLDQTKRSNSDLQQKRVIEDLVRSKEPPQVPPGKIQKNPFELEAETTVAHAGGSDDKKLNALALAEELRRKEQLAALAAIEVGAIMAGNIPLARINGQVVREGDMVGGHFMVKEIHDRSVDLEAADGSIHTINMSESTGGPKPRPPGPRR